MIITYTHGVVCLRFEILTNESYASICGRIQVDPELIQLEYRTLTAGVYSGFSPLRMELDWCHAMMHICRISEEYGKIGIDILNITEPVSFVQLFLS